MESISYLSKYGIHLATACIAYLVTLVVYRLTIHPLARFPGPHLAAITRYYEAYYDVFCNGHYTFKIAELHKKYGKHSLYSPFCISSSAFLLK